MKNHGEVVTESDNTDKEKMSSLEDSSGDDVEYAVEGESFVARRGFNVQVKENDLEEKRENFHMRCNVENKVYIYDYRY